MSSSDDWDGSGGEELSIFEPPAPKAGKRKAKAAAGGGGGGRRGGGGAGSDGKASAKRAKKNTALENETEGQKLVREEAERRERRARDAGGVLSRPVGLDPGDANYVAPGAPGRGSSVAIRGRPAALSAGFAPIKRGRAGGVPAD